MQTIQFKEGSKIIASDDIVVLSDGTNFDIKIPDFNTVALDCDGVIYNCYPPINNRIIKEFNLSEDFRIQKIVKSWGLLELPEKIRKYALKCMADASIVEQYSLKKGSKKFVKDLYELCESNGAKLCFNTHCLNDEVGEVRYKQIVDLAKEIGITPSFNVSCGPNKLNLSSTVIIDDHMGNLCASNATTKILFSTFHNRNLNEQGAFRSNDYNKIVDYLKATAPL